MGPVASKTRKHMENICISLFKAISMCDAGKGLNRVSSSCFKGGPVVLEKDYH